MKKIVLSILFWMSLFSTSQNLVASHNSLEFHGTCPAGLFGSSWQCYEGVGISESHYCALDFFTGDYFVQEWVDCHFSPNSRGCYQGTCDCEYTCSNGGRLLDTCECDCSTAPRKWGGAFCDLCKRNNSECKNGGSMSAATCDCTCPRTCENGGTQNADCSCSCPADWTGDTCSQCTRSNAECPKNDGYMNLNTCQCECPRSCQHGSTEGADCSCACKADSGWTGGDLCQTCERQNSECANNGSIVRDTCQCTCPETCENSGVQKGNCACTCPGDWEGDKCETCGLTAGDCVNNSVLNTETCKCECAASESCLNKGTLGDSCECNCPNPWRGDKCQHCSLNDGNCKNGARMDDTICECSCAADTAKCENLSVRSTDGTCGCECKGDWAGDNCGTCGLDLNHCKGAGLLDKNSCGCDCSQAADCVNGAMDDQCQCKCQPEWKGPTCAEKSGAARAAKASAAMLILMTAYQFASILF